MQFCLLFFFARDLVLASIVASEKGKTDKGDKGPGSIAKQKKA